MIVEFIEEREFLLAWVLAPATHRLGVLAMNGREMTISHSRILGSVELPDPGAKAGRLELLRATDAARRVLAGQVDLDELWEILDGEGEEFRYETLAALFFGRATGPDEISALARAVFADGLKFRFTPQGAVRQNAEEVARLAEARARAEEAERVLTVLADWVRASAKGGPAPEPPEGGRAREILSDLALWGEQAQHKALAKKLLDRAGLAPDEAGAFQALVRLGEFSRHENLELRRLDIPLQFSSEAAEAVGRLTGGRRAASPGRLDLTALRTLTIDSNGARDLDDAISIKSLAGGRWQVGIHITDVAEYVTPGSPLDEAARARASSIYLPEGKYPMLPAELSEGLLSLTPGDVKPAFSILATLEKDGRVSECSLASSLIRVDRQFSFSEADQSLDEDSDLVDLWDLAQALIARREAQGGRNLNLPKLNIYFLPDGSLSVGLTQWDTPAKIIVGELMILANHLAADLLHKKGWPCPFRYQEKSREPGPGEETAEAGLPQDDVELARHLAARRRTGRSGLSFVPAAHHGLGLPIYTAFTAPMRRYLDLLVARQLRALADNGREAMTEQEFLRLALPAHELSMRIQKMQSARQRYWLKVHLADRIGHEYSAIPFEQRDRRLRVCLTDFMLEAEVFLPKGEGGRPPACFGRRLKVKLAALPPGDEPPRFEVAS